MKARLRSRQGDALDADIDVLKSQLSIRRGEMTWLHIDASADPQSVLADVKRTLATDMGFDPFRGLSIRFDTGPCPKTWPENRQFASGFSRPHCVKGTLKPRSRKLHYLIECAQFFKEMRGARHDLK